MKLSHRILPFLCAALLSPLHAETYNNWELFLTEGLAGLSNGTLTPSACSFEATADVRQGADWTGNNGTANNPIPGEVAINGNGYSLSGAGYMFGGNYPKYTGNLSLRDWSSFGGYTQTGSNNAPLFQVSTGSITVSNSKIENNSFNLSQKVTGGVIYAYSGATAQITNSTFANNTLLASSSNGKGNGLVLHNAGTASISNSAFTDNKYLSTKSETWGAAIMNTGSVELREVEFSGNAAAKGGAIYNKAGTLDISGGSFTENTALIYSSSSYGGGAIFSTGTGSAITVEGTTFSKNQGHAGGAVYEDGKGAWEITNSTFTNNTATSSNGGAIRAASGSTWQIEGSSFEGNSATNKGAYGGAMWLTSATAAFIDTDFTNNSTGRTNSGGALYLAGSTTATIAAQNEDVLISGNLAGTGDNQTLSRNAITIGSSSASLYLNAAEGKTLCVSGDSIVGTSTSSNYYTMNTVCINSGDADANVMEDGVQSAGTGGTVRFEQGSVIENINMTVGGGTLDMKDTTLYSSSITLSGNASATLDNTIIGCRNSDEFDYYSKPRQLYTSFTLEDAASATITDSTFQLAKASDGSEEIAIIMSVNASLTLSGEITLDLTDLYSSREELVIDDEFVLRIISIQDTPTTLSLPEEDALAGTAGLHLSGLRVSLVYGGEDVLYSGYEVDTASLISGGTLQFVSAVPEPATTLLSLLALSLLPARRRRQA